MEELEKTYDPAKVEEKIYQFWKEGGYFKPEINPGGEPYCIIMPPPNANGSLHLGHAVFVTLEDIMTRFARMNGKAALWLPGADHAGFETQVVFEKRLEKEGKSRFQIERDELYKMMWDFTQENKKIMEGQLKKLGASCDWDREKFTLDEDIKKLVYKTFKKLYDDGLVYRASRLVNWCPKHQTSLSDLEVKYDERNDFIYEIKYGPITVATTRPETLFGDVAVAVHPEDDKYKDLVGKTVPLPLTDREIPIIADEAVEREFGTGAVKITPAHDPLDFEIGKRHKLKVIQVIDERGKIVNHPEAQIKTETLGKIEGMKAEEARKVVVELLKEAGVLGEIKELTHTVGTCYKCGRTIEPLPREQWYVAMTKKGEKSGKALAPDALKAVEEGKVKFVPQRFEKIFNYWLNNIRDWNISRQIIWGIQIPAWFLQAKEPVEITYFVHGTTEDNEENKCTGWNQGELSELGKEQNSQLRETLSKEKFDLVFTSDLKRGIESAKTVFPEAKIIVDERLRECNYGDLNGKSEKEFKSEEFYIEEKHPKGESYKDVELRLRDLLEEIIKKYPGKKIALMAHKAPQLALEVIINGQSWTEVIKNDWRKDKKWQPGWVYRLDKLVKIGEESPGPDWAQDTDVFDTWFSSGQWPVITLQSLDEKNKTQDFETFYPTAVMETAADILFFWVARMIMFGLYLTDKPPFKDVYLHGLVRDKDRQKMSKSKGNVIDPLGVAAEYGTDAVRMALVFGTGAGNDTAISEEKIRGMRNFANKIWNVARFILMNAENVKAGEEKPQGQTASDQMILEELAKTSKSVTGHYKNYRFSQAGEELYEFIWHKLADQYIEASKEQLKDEKLKENTERILLYVLTTSLQLLHPIMPYITEEIYSKIYGEKRPIIISAWPKP